jgi:hypothetical protein
MSHHEERKRRNVMTKRRSGGLIFQKKPTFFLSPGGFASPILVSANGTMYRFEGEVLSLVDSGHEIASKIPRILVLQNFHVDLNHHHQHHVLHSRILPFPIIIPSSKQFIVSMVDKKSPIGRAFLRHVTKNGRKSSAMRHHNPLSAQYPQCNCLQSSSSSLAKEMREKNRFIEKWLHDCKTWHGASKKAQIKKGKKSTGASPAVDSQRTSVATCGSISIHVRQKDGLKDHGRSIGERIADTSKHWSVESKERIKNEVLKLMEIASDKEEWELAHGMLEGVDEFIPSKPHKGCHVPQSVVTVMMDAQKNECDDVQQWKKDRFAVFDFPEDDQLLDVVDHMSRKRELR